MAQGVLFPCRQRVSRHAAAPRIGGPRGDPKSIKKQYEKQGLKKRSQKRPWGARGEPRKLPGAPVKPKWTRKGSKNGAQNDIVEGWAGEMEDVTKTYYLLHFSHIGRPRKSRFWLNFGCFFYTFLTFSNTNS